MKKLLSILGAIGIAATTASSVVACGGTTQAKKDINLESTNTPYVSINEYNNAYNKQAKVKNTFIKDFLTHNNEIGLNQDQWNNLQASFDTKTGISNLETKIQNDSNPLIKKDDEQQLEELNSNYDKYNLSIQNDSNIKDKLLAKFDTQLRLYGLISDTKSLYSKQVKITFTELTPKSSAYGSNGRPGFTAQLKYGNSSNFFTLTEFFNENLNSPLLTIDNNNIETFNANEKVVEKDMQNIGGYFMFEKWDGTRNTSNQPIGIQKISVDETNKLGFDYFTGWLKAAGVLDLNSSISINDFGFNFFPSDKITNGYYSFDAGQSGGWHSTMPNATKTINWKNNDQYTYNVSGSILCLDPNSAY